MHYYLGPSGVCHLSPNIFFHSEHINLLPAGHWGNPFDISDIRGSFGRRPSFHCLKFSSVWHTDATFVYPQVFLVIFGQEQFS